MRLRLAARLLVVDQKGSVLLFRFRFAAGALTGQDYWATPGGGVEPGETLEEAARRELYEETGLRCLDVGREMGRRRFPMQLMSGERVMAEESFFRVRTRTFEPTRQGWSADEVTAIADHRWRSLDEIENRTVQIWPEDLAALVRCEASSGD